MTTENEDPLKTAVRAIYAAYEDENEADSALSFINPAFQGGATDTQFVVAKMISAVSTAMFFLNEDVDITAEDRAGFGHLLECAEQALHISMAREDVRRERVPKVRAIGGAE